MFEKSNPILHVLSNLLDKSKRVLLSEEPFPSVSIIPTQHLFQYKQIIVLLS